MKQKNPSSNSSSMKHPEQHSNAPIDQEQAARVKSGISTNEKPARKHK